ncbi:MAG: hypothetical protein US40_C0004G0048 [Candidatus Roizmanbacteria bacterium GW2011_GWC2_37_13]|uniref:Uncharacterized protein n=1 Tax=Candidatus Roizmanbacteria bacterium GW2011_GWC2_37_13 TaxID=1618486 RepID=A0A0G0G4F7_9BACT|nr:MAG: hypothetical protein US38_C0001G0035 [Candidatus Roizmanbacteria bacterium GW2011_GWC1_37_12]KKQ26013.1 MAG: hypothetical protein US40_C0004G0048 [Candidatus Roizmanbacteria bacterium GW2011_GWC2_37_13]
MPDPRPIRREEIKTPKDFITRLNRPDAITVGAVIKNIRILANQHKINESQGRVFFAVYGIAGNISKSGERPDVDLLIVTNARWSQGHIAEDWNTYLSRDNNAFSGDWVAGTLRDRFSTEGYKVILVKKIPNQYSKVGVRQKGIVRLEPQSEGRKPIDIVIVNHICLINQDITTLKQFEEVGDVNKKGKPLPRVLLFKTEHETASDY